MSTGAEIPDPSAIRPWPADQVERWPIERLIPYANNPRLHSEADLDKIAAAIVARGGMIPVLADGQQAFGQSLGERTQRQDDDQSGAGHGEKSIRRH